jgi:hypothetical protein
VAIRSNAHWVTFRSDLALFWHGQCEPQHTSYFWYGNVNRHILLTSGTAMSTTTYFQDEIKLSLVSVEEKMKV